MDVGLGYYSRNGVTYLAAAEPPAEQFVYSEGTWWPLADGFALAYLIVTGDVDLDGPTAEPPDGIPPGPVLARL